MALRIEPILDSVGDEYLSKDDDRKVRQRDPQTLNDIRHSIDIAGSIYRAKATIHRRGKPFKERAAKTAKAANNLRKLMTEEIIKHAAHQLTDENSYQSVRNLPSALKLLEDALKAGSYPTRFERSPFEMIAGETLPAIYYKEVARIQLKNWEDSDAPCVRFVHACLKELKIHRSDGKPYSKTSVAKAIKDVRTRRARTERRGRGQN